MSQDIGYDAEWAKFGGKALKHIPIISLCAMFVLVPLVIVSDGLYQYELLPKLLVFYVCGFVATAAVCLGKRKAESIVPALCWVAWALQAWGTGYSLGNMALADVTFQFVLASFALMLTTFTPSDLDPLWWCATLTGLLIALLGIAQYFGLELSFIPQSGPPAATFANRNLLAEYLVCVIPVAIWLFWRSWSRREIVASGLAASLMGACLVYTRCRAAWVGMAVGLVILTPSTFNMPLWRPLLRSTVESIDSFRRFKFRLWGGLVALFAVLSILPGNLYYAPKVEVSALDTVASIATSSTADNSVNDRLTYWKASLRMIADHPVFGVGPAGWIREYPHYQTRASFWRNPHNDYLWIAAEYGIVGLGIWLWVLIWTGRRLWRMQDGGRFFCAALVAVSVAACFGFPREQPDTMIWVWLFVGIAGRVGL